MRAVEGEPHSAIERPARAGYSIAILVAALLHGALFFFALVVLPRYWRSDEAPLPAYTVKIVDNVPAGDLGTHLPRLNRPKPPALKVAAPKPPPQPKVEAKPPPPPEPSHDDKHELAMNIAQTPSPTPTPEITPPPSPAPTAAATPIVRKLRRLPPPPPPQPVKREKPPAVMIAKAEPTTSVQEQLAKLREKMLAEHVAEAKASPEPDEDEDESDSATATPAAGPRGGGPVAANSATLGSGYGVGPGTGSAGILQDPEFLLYYNAVQQKIKQSWSFIGGSPDLTATVEFAIGPDGALSAIKVSKSSNDPAFDDSVVRAIRSAAPFPPPPDKYKPAFAQGVEAMFKLGELKNS
ncbi:MAG TPA: cell envelope integrity protein TolA [Candidatus Binataceae bacterium]|nr:cell envelope integrity protein TolA [Candidatus Binataceae bacterium]